MRVASWLLLVSSACSFNPVEVASTDAGSATERWLDGYAFRKIVTVSSGTHAALADFPLAIVEGSDPQLAAHALADGGDLVVTDDAMTPLPREIVGFDPASGALELWVRVPSLAAGQQTLYLYYGGPPDTTTAADVWSAGFAAVWHLGDLLDSTGHGHTLGAGAQAPTAVGGIAGSARYFDGSVPSLAASATGLDFPTSSFSFSAWLDLATSPSNYAEALYHGGINNPHPGYCLLVGPEWDAKIHDGMNNYSDPSLGVPATLVGQWHQVAGVVDRGQHTVTAYTDGIANEGSNAQPVGSIASTEAVEIGHADMAPFAGTVDEVRIYDHVLSADWIAAEHDNLAKPGFVTVGAERAR